MYSVNDTTTAVIDPCHTFSTVQSTDMSNAIGNIALALSKTQSELESAKKGTEGYGYSYSDLSTVIQAAKDVLAKNDLAVTQLVSSEGENACITTILVHKSGEYFRSHASMPIVEMKGTNVAQRHGATISYLRRYSYQAIIGMASEDCDASTNGFGKKGKTSFSKKETKVTTPVETADKPRQKFRREAKKKDTGHAI